MYLNPADPIMDSHIDSNILSSAFFSRSLLSFSTCSNSLLCFSLSIACTLVLSKLSDGLFTQVTTEFDKKGVDFSGGESQKVAISRAFYKKADILIMDEPSSALDPIAEYELNKAMQSAAKGKTVFYISHRLSTTRDADRIIMLERGRIIEEGTHEELLSRGGKYAEMWNAQAGKYN